MWILHFGASQQLSFSFSAMGKGAGYLQLGLPPNSKPDAKFALNQRGWRSWRVFHIQKRRSYVFLRDISHILLVSRPRLSTWQCRSVTSCLWILRAPRIRCVLPAEKGPSVKWFFTVTKGKGEKEGERVHVLHQPDRDLPVELPHHQGTKERLCWTCKGLSVFIWRTLCQAYASSSPETSDCVSSVFQILNPK